MWRLQEGSSVKRHGLKQSLLLLLLLLLSFPFFLLTHSLQLPSFRSGTIVLFLLSRNSCLQWLFLFHFFPLLWFLNKFFAFTTFSVLSFSFSPRHYCPPHHHHHLFLLTITILFLSILLHLGFLFPLRNMAIILYSFFFWLLFFHFSFFAAM